jgi:simple sugar transport system substrate-binding protein
MTKTNVLGVVASIPIPEVIRNIDSFTLGAQSVNPKVTTRVVWVNKWFDPPKEGEGAQALMNDGADVLMQNTDSSAVLQAAEKAGKHGFGWDSDMSKYGPHAHLGSAVINWAPYYKKSVGDVLDGTRKTGQTWWGVKEGAIDLVSLSPQVPAAVKQKLDTVKAGLKAGTYAIWKGPVMDQGGKVVLKDGESADDKFLHGINFYVNGVQGTLPAAK